LDGGHLVFYFYEAVTGQKPNAGALQVLTMIGVGLLAALMLFAVFNDVIGCV
jgi:regulator of sigma E protease